MLNTLKVKRAESTGQPYRIADIGGMCKGLGLRVSAKGHKSFELCMRRNGVRKFWKIGDAANTSLSDARQEGLTLRKQIELGNDPREQTKTKVATLEELCDAYVDHLEAKGSKCSADVKRALRHDCKSLYNKPANKVTPPEIADVLRKPVKRGSKGQANRVYSYLHAAYNWAMEADLDPLLEKNGTKFQINTNPVSAVRKPQKGSRALDRWLSEAEIKQVWGVLPKYTGPIPVAALRLMLCTGQRTQEVLGMKWIDIEDDVWTIPTTKNGKPHEVVLNEMALSTIKDLRKLTGHCEIAFLQKHAAKTPMDSNTLSNATRRMCKKEGIVRFTPRDLRRTFKSMAMKHGLQKDILDKVQNHAQNDVSSKHYVKYAFLNEKREAMLQWNEILVEVLS